jgi:hypothetical protein
MNQFGFVRVTAAGHATCIANPLANASEACANLDQFADSDVVVFGELSLAGYTCGDLFAQQHLLDQVIEALGRVVEHTRARNQLVIVGLQRFVMAVFWGWFLNSICRTIKSFMKRDGLRLPMAVNRRRLTWAS